MRRLLNISQLARLSGRSRNTIKAMLTDGRISSETAPDGKRGVSIAEACRVFSLSSSALESELEFERVRPAQSVATNRASGAPDGALHDESGAQVARLQAEVEHLRAMNSMLSELVNTLKSDKQELLTLLKEQMALSGQLGRLLPAKSSVKRSAASTQPRDDKSRFSGVGRGADALLQGSLVEDGGQAHD